MNNSEDIIKNILFIKIGGIPLIFLKNIGKDTFLISGYLEAFKNFSSELENAGELRSINLSKLTFSYYSNNPEFYVISINDSRVPIENLNEFMKDLHDGFLEKYTIDEIKYWDKSIDRFKSYLPVIMKKIEDFYKLCLPKLSDVSAEPFGLRIQDIFKNNKIYAIIFSNPAKKDIRSFVNPDLEDFELQVFIASPYFNRILINFIPTLANIGKMLLETKGQHYFIRSSRFQLGLRQKDSHLVGILGTDKEAIVKHLLQI